MTTKSLAQTLQHVRLAKLPVRRAALLSLPVLSLCGGVLSCSCCCWGRQGRMLCCTSINVLFCMLLVRLARLRA